MAHKNSEKCGDILKYAYYLFSHNDYCNVYLKEIAEQIGLSKSQLQNLYPQKSELMRELFDEYISFSFQYIEKTFPEDINLYYKLSMHTIFFWKVVDSNKELNTFMMNMISDYSLRAILIDRVYQWHREMKYKGDDISKNVNLKPALIFSISGGLELYLQRENLNIEIEYIMQHLIAAFMRMLGCSGSQIDDVINRTAEWLPTVDINQFLMECLEEIEWM